MFSASTFMGIACVALHTTFLTKMTRGILDTLRLVRKLEHRSRPQIWHGSPCTPLPSMPHGLYVTELSQLLAGPHLFAFYCLVLSHMTCPWSTGTLITLLHTRRQMSVGTFVWPTLPAMMSLSDEGLAFVAHSLITARTVSTIPTTTIE